MKYHSLSVSLCHWCSIVFVLQGCDSPGDGAQSAEEIRQADEEHAVSVQLEIPDIGEGYAIGRLADGALGLDGSVFLLDRYQGTVLHFDETGAFLGTIGRRGEGPGELSGGVVSIDVLADSSITILDLSLSRVLNFDMQGRYVATQSIPTPPGFVRRAEVLDDGRVLAESVGSGTVSLVSLTEGRWETLRSSEVSSSVRFVQGRLVEPVVQLELHFSGSNGTLISHTAQDSQVTVHAGSLDAGALSLPAPTEAGQEVRSRLNELWESLKVSKGADAAALEMMAPGLPSVVPSVAGLRFDASDSTLYALKVPPEDS